jgi:hypothetical protein
MGSICGEKGKDWWRATKSESEAVINYAKARARQIKDEETNHKPEISRNLR